MHNNSLDSTKPFLDFSAPRAQFDTSITDLVRIEVSRFGASSPGKEFLLNNFKEFTDLELKSVWVNGLRQSWELVDLASQYKTNAGTIYPKKNFFPRTPKKNFFPHIVLHLFFFH